jgi:hypothetical protein
MKIMIPYHELRRERRERREIEIPDLWQLIEGSRQLLSAKAGRDTYFEDLKTRKS